MAVEKILTCIGTVGKTSRICAHSRDDIVQEGGDRKGSAVFPFVKHGCDVASRGLKVVRRCFQSLAVEICSS